MPDTATPASVVLMLGGKPHILVPSLHAMRVAGRISGGFVPLFKALSNISPDVMVALAIAGMGVAGQEAENLEAAIYAEGFESILAPLVEFASLCANGGRPQPQAGQDGAGRVVPKPADALTEEQIAAMRDAVSTSTRATAAELVAGFDDGPKGKPDPTADVGAEVEQPAADKAGPAEGAAPSADPALH